MLCYSSVVPFLKVWYTPKGYRDRPQDQSKTWNVICARTKLSGKEQSRGMRYHRYLWNCEQHWRNCVCLRKIKGAERNYLLVNSIPNAVPSFGSSHIKWQTCGHPGSLKISKGSWNTLTEEEPLTSEPASPHSSYCCRVAGKLSACADKVCCEYQAIYHYKCREEELKTLLDFQYSEKEGQNCEDW